MSSTLHKPEIVKDWVENSGLTRGAIAQMSGISRWTLWRMERGNPCPIENVLALATALNKPAAAALTDESRKRFAAICQVT